MSDENLLLSTVKITNISSKSETFIKNKIKNSNYGFFIPHEIGKKNIFFGFHGGAEWMGASINNDNGMMYVTSHNIPFIGKIYEDENKFSYYKYYSGFERLFDKNGYPGSKPPWGNLTAINLNSGKIKWQVPFGEYEELTKIGIPLTGTENYGGATGTAGNLVFATGTLDKKIRAFNKKIPVFVGGQAFTNGSKAKFDATIITNNQSLVQLSKNLKKSKK